jgi:hypothetical protein
MARKLDGFESGDAVDLGQTGAVHRILEDAVLGLWDIVDELTRIRPKRLPTYNVTIFGSSRIKPDHRVYEIVRRLARDLADLGCTIITGGGPGLMQAANEGARQSSGEGGIRSLGIRIDLPFEQEVNSFVDLSFRHRTFFTRLHHFVLLSDAYIVVPGGVGTLLEMTMIWQLLQVRKLYDRPLILVGAMWPSLLRWAREFMIGEDFRLVDDVDLTIPRCVDSPEDAIAILRERREAWSRLKESDESSQSTT